MLYRNIHMSDILANVTIFVKLVIENLLYMTVILKYAEQVRQDFPISNAQQKASVDFS